MCEEGLHDPFQDQVDCARFRAERDMLAQAMERVADDIEQTFLGFEGAEDAPAMRWAREFRAALGSLHAPARDTTMSARDLLPEEEREAIAWVREHGGLDAVKRRWECLSYYADPVPRACMERRLASRQRQIDESHAALRRRNQRIALLASEINRAHNENRMEFLRRAGNYTAFADEVCKRLAPQLRYMEGCSKNVMDAALDALDRRLMPDGMEWLVEAWPRFEDDSPVHFGDTALIDGEADMVEAVQLWIHGNPVIYGDGGSQQLDKGERVKRSVADTWERLEKDVAGASCPDVYCANHRVDASDTSYEWAMARDIVRRAKALAERG